MLQSRALSKPPISSVRSLNRVMYVVVEFSFSLSFVMFPVRHVGRGGDGGGGAGSPQVQF